MSNRVTVAIENRLAGLGLTHKSSWLQTGEITGLTDKIKAPGTGELSAKGTLDTGVSGYVVYTLAADPPVDLTFAFSNPVIGTNKIGVGYGDSQWIWEKMTDHYSPTTSYLELLGGKLTIVVKLKNTPGGLNYAQVELEPTGQDETTGTPGDS